MAVATVGAAALVTAALATTTAAGTWAGIDDVALTVTLVPEPGAVALVSLLSLPLLRRRRK